MGNNIHTNVFVPVSVNFHVDTTIIALLHCHVVYMLYFLLVSMQSRKNT